jgi:hypothetical protein
MPDATPPVNRYRRSSSRSSDKSAVLTSSKLLSTLQQWFPCGPLLAGHLTQSPPGLFLPRSRPSPSDNSRRRWFGVRSCKPTSRGRPSSVKQLRILLSCEIRVLMARYERQYAGSKARVRTLIFIGFRGPEALLDNIKGRPFRSTVLVLPKPLQKGTPFYD